MKGTDTTLVRGCKLPKEALLWLVEVEKYFPGATKDIVIVRQGPISSLPREGEKGTKTQREKA
jgi:hypothetical protein